jgi:heme/copper-type cytochrome/quinol oxidase subunit 4
MDPRATLVWTTVASNAVLLASYWAMGINTRDFGNVSPTHWSYFLGCAAVAYAALLVAVGLMAATKDADDSDLAIATWSITAYVAMQLAFVPLVRLRMRGGPGWPTRALLIACVIPIALFAGTAVRVGGMWLIGLSILAAAHVLINDAVLFGFTFDR